MEKTTLPLSWKKQPYPYPRRGQPMLYWNTTTYSIIMEDTTLSWKKQSSPYPRKGPTVIFFFIGHKGDSLCSNALLHQHNILNHHRRMLWILETCDNFITCGLLASQWCLQETFLGRGSPVTMKRFYNMRFYNIHDILKNPF